METRYEKVIAIYCFLDDFLQQVGKKPINKTYQQNLSMFRCTDIDYRFGSGWFLLW